MKKLIFFLFLLPFLAQSQIYLKPNNAWGTIFNRGSFDSTVFIPTSCGVPTDSTWLFSYGFTGAGQKLHKAALYYDSCGHHLYGWDPSLLAWHRIDSSGGGGSTYTADEVSLHLTGTQFSIKSTYPGQSSIAILGTVTSGIWNSTAITDTYISSSTNWNAKLGSTLNSANIFVGNSSNIATGVTPSGDWTISNTGAATNTKMQGRTFSATAPSNGQVYVWVTANNDWEPQNQSGGGGATLPFNDNLALIQNNADNTRKLIFSAASVPTGTTNTWTFPGVNGTVARNDAAQNFAGTQTFSSAPIFSSLIGYLKGNGASAITASSSIPEGDVTNLNTDLSSKMGALTKNPTTTNSPTFSSGTLNIDTNRYERVINILDYPGVDPTGATDCTTGIQTAINDAAKYVGNVKILVPIGTYSINGSLLSDCQCQLKIPVDTIENLSTNIVFVGEGENSPGNFNMISPFTTRVDGIKGAVIYSKYAGVSSTTNAAVFGTASPTSTYFNLNTATFRHLVILMKYNPNGNGPEVGGICGRYLVGLRADDIAVQPDTSGNALVTPTKDVAGIETPDNSGGANYYITNCAVSGMRWGYVFGEHVTGDALSAAMCYRGYGMKIAYHASHFGRIGTYWNTNGMAWYPFAGHLGAATNCWFSIDQLAVEYGTGNTASIGYINTQYDVNDSLNKFKADINYNSVTQNAGNDNSTWVMKGASGVIARAMASGGATGLDATLTAGNNSSQLINLTGFQTTRSTINMGSSARAQDYDQGDFFFGENITYSGGYKYVNNGAASQIYFLNGGSNGAIVMQTAPTGTAGATVTTVNAPFVLYNTSAGLGGSISNYTGSFTGAKFIINGGTGQAQLPSYTSSSAFTGTPVANLQVDASGNILTGTVSTNDGIYVPVITNASNTSALSADSAIWSRSGNTVTVSGSFTCTTTSTSASCGVHLTLPVPSLLNGGHALFGAATTDLPVTSQGICSADPTNHGAAVGFFSTASTGSVTFYYTYQYRVQ